MEGWKGCWGKSHKDQFWFSRPGTVGRLRSLSPTANVAWFMTMGFGAPVEPDEWRTRIGPHLTAS